MDDPDIIICHDLGTEIADFIVSGIGPGGPKAILIHAKAGSGDGLHPHSASEISEDCLQALKSIRYLATFNTLRPENLGRWAKRWKVAKAKGYVTKRIRRGSAKPATAWAELKERILNPQCEREVWLLLGRMLSQPELEAGLKADPPIAEAVQAVTLLHATLAAVGSIDAKLRVFCYEA